MNYSETRQLLHNHPQTAGNEQFAHDIIVEHLKTLHPDEVYDHVCGYGVIAVWHPCDNNVSCALNALGHGTIAFRADIDALPIGHRCGHDGHTTILLRLADLVDELYRSGNQPLDRSVLLLWQPAEETGTGAEAIMESGILQRYDIRAFYALHNLPGYEEGKVVLRHGTFAAASSGVVYHFEGRETHASTPEMGINPGLAVAEVIQEFSCFNYHDENDLRQSTLICVNLGEPAFGTSAGKADVMFTLREYTNDGMASLLDAANATVDDIARRHSLKVERTYREPFKATENHEPSVQNIELAAKELGMKCEYRSEPFRWSEDFGTYLMRYPGAMFGIGAGKEHAELHHPAYEFPDGIIEPAARIFLKLISI